MWEIYLGDIAFRNKSLRKMYEIRSQSKGVIFISHNIEQVMNICDRVIVMDKGKISYVGDVSTGIIHYYDIMSESKQKSITKQEAHSMSKGKYILTDDITLIDAGLQDDQQQIVDTIGFGDNINVFFDFRINKPIEEPKFSVVIRNEMRKDVVWVQNNDSRLFFGRMEPGEYRLIVRFEHPNLVPNVYDLGFTLANYESQEVLVQIQGYKVFRVREQDFVPRGTIYLKHQWDLQKK